MFQQQVRLLVGLMWRSAGANSSRVKRIPECKHLLTPNSLLVFTQPPMAISSTSAPAGVSLAASRSCARTVLNLDLFCILLFITFLSYSSVLHPHSVIDLTLSFSGPVLSISRQSSEPGATSVDVVIVFDLPSNAKEALRHLDGGTLFGAIL